VQAPRPLLAEVADGLAVHVEDVWAVETARLYPPLDHRRQLPFEREHAAVPILAVFGPEADHAVAAIVVTPFERVDFAHAPRDEEKEADGVREVGRQLGGHRFDFLTREEPLAHAAKVRRELGR
jgi:hypothetical protein